MAELLLTINDEQWNAWMNSARITDMILEMPKFEESHKYVMDDPLKALGLTNLYYSPDLSGMFDELYNLYVSTVLHDTYISVDEAGTEAAAVTAIIIEYTSAGPIVIEVKLDHPFIYAIQDAETHAIIFIGIMKDPTQ